MEHSPHWRSTLCKHLDVVGDYFWSSLSTFVFHERSADKSDIDVSLVARLGRRSAPSSRGQWLTQNPVVQFSSDTSEGVMMTPESTERLSVYGGPDAETSLDKFDIDLSLVARKLRRKVGMHYCAVSEPKDSNELLTVAQVARMSAAVSVPKGPMSCWYDLSWTSRS